MNWNIDIDKQLKFLLVDSKKFIESKKTISIPELELVSFFTFIVIEALGNSSKKHRKHKDECVKIVLKNHLIIE